MKCSICQNFISIPRECKLCKETLCSDECYISHNQIFHQSNLEQSKIDNSINNNSFLNYAKETSQIQSPFLVLGIMNYDYIVYDPMYSLENFTLIYSNGIPKSVGNGSFGQVFLAINNIDQKTYAIKHMEKEKLINYLNCLDPIYAEIDIQSRVNHPNILKLLFVKETEVTFDLVMDYAKDGTLFEYVVKNKGLPEKIAFKYFIQIVNAIKFLHDNDIIHRDIKPENILLFDNDIVKLCDFGWSIKCVDRLPGGSFTGTTEYMAPELINNMDYGKEIDNWMLGIMLYELMHGFSPFRPKKAKFEDNEVVYNIQTHNINFYVPVSDDCKELIFSLLETDVNKRCTVDEIFNSKFVKNFQKEEFEISSSNFEKDENENTERNIRISNSNINSEIPNENNLNPISKSELINRYTEIEEFNDSRKKLLQENNISQSIQIYDIKKIEKGLSNSNLNTNMESVIVNNKKENLENSLNVDEDPFEDEDDPSAPKNNNRNRLKNKKNMNNSLVKLELNLNNENIVSSAKNQEEENQQKTISNSPKNNDKKKKKYKNDLIFDLNPNTILNNSLLTSRRFRKNTKEKEDLEISEDHSTKRRNILINQNKKQNINEITNYIFNNNKELDNKKKLLAKKLTLNTNHQMLSLSLSPGTVEYASILARSISPDKPLNFSKEKNYLIDKKYNFPDNWSNASHNIREYPFDHLASNSSLDVRKTLCNNKVNRSEIRQYEKKNIEFIIEKEPNDNMRRKNKRKEMPIDNIMKNNINKNLKPKDNNKKGRCLANNLNKENINRNYKNKYEIKTTNSAINESISLNSINPITKSIIKKIKESNNNNPESKAKSIRNFSVSTTYDLRTNRQNSDDFNKNSKNDNSQNFNKQQNKNIELISNQEIIYSNNLKGDSSPKIANSVKINEKYTQPKKICNKNMSFVAKNKNQIMFGNSNENNKIKERKQNFLDNKSQKKGLSVNKQLRNFSKVSKKRNDKKEIKPIKYYKKINKENNKNIINRDNIKDIKVNNENKVNEYKGKEDIEKIVNKTIENTDERNIQKLEVKIDENKENKVIQKNEKEEIKIEKKNVFESNQEIKEEKEMEIKEEKIEIKKVQLDKNDFLENINSVNKINVDKEDNKKINKDIKIIKDFSENEGNIEKSNENINKTKDDNSHVEISNSNAYKEVKVIKENKENKLNEENRENIEEKQIMQSNETSSLIKAEENKNKKNENILNKNIISNNNNENKKNIRKSFDNKNEINQINNKDKQNIRDDEFNLKKIDNENLIKKTIEKDKEEKEPKDKLQKIFKKSERKSSKEKRYKMVKIDPSKKVKNSKKINSNQNNSQIQKSKFPKKLSSKSNQNNGQLTNSSSKQEYSIPQNKNEKKIKYSYHKTNNSNSESKTTCYSKNKISNIKNKIKRFSVVNNDEINVIFNKSKSPDTRKKFFFKNKLEIKGDNSEDLEKSKRLENDIDNKTYDIKINEKIKDDEHENKENIELNKRFIDKSIDKKEIINLSMQKKEQGIIKKPKKKYRKVKSDDNIKAQNEHNEKFNNDSESFIIDGDSEYGESEIF